MQLRLAKHADLHFKPGMSSGTHTQAQIQSVQALRGIAALLVVIFHANLLHLAVPGEMSGKFGALWEQGYAGVDVFFVISGFIMVFVTRVTAPSAKTALRFAYARVTRIYPLWWVFALAMIGCYFIQYGQAAAPKRAAGDAILPYLLKSFLLIPQSDVPVLGVGWTLIHEIFFYGLFAVTLFLPRRFLKFFLLAWAALIAAVSLKKLPPDFAATYWHLLTFPLNMEFILGACVGLAYLRGRLPWARLALFIGIICFLYGLAAGVTQKPGLFLWQRVLAYGLPSAAILYGFVSLERSGQIRMPGELSHLGDWSYSLYLSHPIVILVIREIWIRAESILPDSLQYHSPGPADDVLYFALTIGGAIIFSALSYKLIERPLLIGSRKLWPRQS